ncbi:hypothetical protein DPMN_157701 [Dreissena polymorpha]|uniref:Uncharacterized protein n=1 Tax=Dreissena polymorpha TaxID=45954 RepID=A0A9D4EID8_DREPO|nr:hypothetical protein DPMN_157701 [Dreissena polymorpha]
MKKRVGAIEEFAFEPLTLLGSKYDPTRTVKQLNITIAVTGWLNEKVQGNASDLNVRILLFDQLIFIFPLLTLENYLLGMIFYANVIRNSIQ